MEIQLCGIVHQPYTPTCARDITTTRAHTCPWTTATTQVCKCPRTTATTSAHTCIQDHNHHSCTPTCAQDTIATRVHTFPGTTIATRAHTHAREARPSLGVRIAIIPIPNTVGRPPCHESRAWLLGKAGRSTPTAGRPLHPS